MADRGEINVRETSLSLAIARILMDDMDPASLRAMAQRIAPRGESPPTDDRKVGLLLRKLADVKEEGGKR